ncbi:hypothetical protein KFL_004020015 [Klebsormidium nitens]|uniref:EF-hand domain-containing protein n=1 Tax=Klebsormidium nitens TaxID=105231 RepID=A0A1Y1IAX3_KLENI|nr:hypothetical protein KFL_004020015 [Klebsormidium nitens]|eukprot:GAQ88115.1 hypothetical protein KFL_004020015 [Klebsormidium nitens]
MEKEGVDFANSDFWRRKASTADFLGLAFRVELESSDPGQNANLKYKAKHVLDIWLEVYRVRFGDSPKGFNREEYVDALAKAFETREGRLNVAIPARLMFEALDRDRNGVITYKEYGDFLSIKKGDLTNVEQNFNAMDLNGNGTWSFEEFQDALVGFWLCVDEKDVSKHLYGYMEE